MLLPFFLLTTVISWVCFGAAGWIWARTAASFSGWAHAGTFIFLIGVFAPSLVAIVFTERSRGREATTALLNRAMVLPTQARLFVFAIAYIAVIKLAAAAGVRLVTGEWPPFGEEPVYLMLGAMIVSTPVQAGEEIGWRGFALPRMARAMGLGPASLLLGALWATWHLPLFFIHAGDLVGQSFPLYLLQVTAVSAAMAWLFWRSNGSVLIVMLMHAAINNLKDIVPSGTPGASDPWSTDGTPIAWATVGLLWICAVYFLVRMRGADVSRL